MLEMENVVEESTRWFCLRVTPRPAFEQKRSRKGASWSSLSHDPASLNPHADSV
jgi:hypothetical protein